MQTHSLAAVKVCYCKKQLTAGVHFDDFRNDFKNIFPSDLRSPSIVFVIVKNSGVAVKPLA